MAQVYAFFVTGPRLQTGNPYAEGVSLRPPLLSNSQSFFASTLVVQNRLQPSLLSNDQAFFSPTITTGTALVAPLISNSQTFYAPQLNLSLVAGLVTNTQSFFAPIVTTANGLGAPLLSNSQTFYAPSLGLIVTVPKTTNSQSFFGPTITLGATPGQALSTPTVTLTSSAGNPPEADVTMDADIYAGFDLRIQRSPDGIKNVSDGSYTTQTLNITHEVTPSEIAALAITNADLLPDGYFDPTGTWHQQYRWEREDGAISAWSTEISGTVTTSVAKLSSTDKSSATTVAADGLTVGSSSGSGLAKATVSTITTKLHMEIEVLSIRTASSTYIYLGIGEDGLTVSPSVIVFPGNTSSTASGFTLRIDSTASPFLMRNGTIGSTGLGAAAVGDIFAVEYDSSTKQITIKKKRGATITSFGPTTLTSLIPATVRAFAGVNHTENSGEANFGASAFAITPTAGYSYYA